jgi:hypothetical protein
VVIHISDLLGMLRRAALLHMSAYGSTWGQRMHRVVTACGREPQGQLGREAFIDEQFHVALVQGRPSHERVRARKDDRGLDRATNQDYRSGSHRPCLRA